MNDELSHAAEAAAHHGGGVDLPLVVVLVPLFRLIGLGSVLGFLAGGLLIGPFGLGFFQDLESVNRDLAQWRERGEDTAIPGTAKNPVQAL